MQTARNRANEYWAAVSSEKIGDELQGQVDNYYAYLTSSSLVDLWRKSFYAYYGLLSGSALTGYGLFAIGALIASGSEGEVAKLKVNQFKNLLNHLLVLTTQSRPAMECRAINSDAKSSAQAYLGDGILDYFMREKRLEIYLKSAVETALIMGEAFIRLDWDATAGKEYGRGPNGAVIHDGDVVCKAYNPFDVVRDTTRTSSQNHTWYIFHDVDVAYDLAAKYPSLASEILASSTDTTSPRRFVDPTKVIPAAGIGSRPSELLDIYEFIHKPTPSLPSGRYTVFLQGGLTLFDGPLPFKKMPAHRLSYGDVIGSPFGWTVAFDLLGIQEAIDKLYTIGVTNQLATGMQNFWQPPGNQIQKMQLGGGLNLLESVTKPEVLALCQTPPELFNNINKLESVMEVLSGVSAVNRGETPENLKSGSALAFVASQAVTFSSGLQSSYNMLIESVGTTLIDILKDFAATPRLAVISGEFNRPLMRTFIGQDLEQIDRVVVEAVSPVSKTTAGKIEIARDLLQSGLIRNAREYISVVNTGEIQSFIQSEQSELMLVNAENEDLRNGKQVAGLKIDDHKLHILEHRSLLNNPDSRQDPSLVEGVLSHITWHLNEYLRMEQQEPGLLSIIGEQPIPAAAPASAQGPGGPVQTQVAAPNLTEGQDNVKPARMPHLPKGADLNSQEAYAQLQTAS